VNSIARAGLPALLLLLSAVRLPGQTVPAAPSAPTAKDEAITLSPFEVNATQDTGYAGQDTLSGSRLRTNLKDVAAAISPMTAEFIKDIAATNIEQAIEYGVSTRADTDDARAAGPVGDSTNDATRGLRMRGLPGGTRSVNFFSALGELDAYMIDRIEVSRGPNSILYGFGSPAGKINVATKQAMTNKTFNSVTVRADSWGGQRIALDSNLALVKNKLALRINLLRGRDQSWRSYGYNNQDRMFLSAKWQPDRKTTIKVDYEFGRQRKYVPRPFFGVDLRSMWEANGRPLFNNFNASYVPGQPWVPGAAGTPGNAIRDTGVNNVVGVQERSSGDYVVVSDRFAAAQNFKFFTTSEFPTASLISTDFDKGRSNMRSAMEANWVNGKFNADSISATIQRELLPNLNLELAFNRQSYIANTHNISSWYTYGVAVDTNRYLPNGALKPAENLYYFEISPNNFITRTQYKTRRVTLSYEKGYKDWVTLRLAGLGEVFTHDNRFRAFTPTWMKGPDITSGGAFIAGPENGANTVWYRYYINDLGVLNDPKYLIPGPYDLTGATKYQDPKTGAISSIYMQDINRSQGYVVDFDRESGSYMGVAQLFALKNRIAITAGYRKDRLKNWQSLSVRDPAAEALLAGSGTWLPVDPRTTTPTIYSGQTRTIGGVVHLTSWLSAFYNQSSSVNTPGSQWITPKDPTNIVRADIAPSPSGTTDDFGVKLSLLKNRLYLTATQFHTISLNEFSGSGFSRTYPTAIWTALGNSGILSAEETNAAKQQALIWGQIQGYTQDSESRGYEVELVGKLLPNWSVSANFSKTKSSRSNIANELRAYLDYWKPYWLKNKNLALTQNLNVAGAELAPSSTDWRTPAEIAATGDFTVNTDSINEAIADTESAFYDNPHVFEGRPFIGDNKYNLNVRTRYDIASGKLKGLSVGAGMRMRKGRIAGAKSVYELVSGSSYTDAWNGRKITSVTMVEAVDQNLYDLQIGYNFAAFQRKIRWSIQLNVNNLTNERALIVNNTHPTTLAPMTYRYQDPRQFILTNTLSF
jgi:outer membrane receptor protein involved in Fe transport